MTRWGMLAVVGLATAMGAGCGSSSGGGTNDGSGGGPVGGGGESRDGEVYSPEPLVSNVDGEAIAITVLEPTTVTEGATYPLILHSHGYGGARQTTAPA
ncbi:MAG: peptidase S15, partial [Abyssibacter sp.]|nr:peptidase S15 [Abyssibacter sp.]